MIYVLYGQPASGKTTLGKLLSDYLGTPFFIDGDEFREMFSNKDYGETGRTENIRSANSVATYLNKKGAKGGWKAVYVDMINGWKGHHINDKTDVVMSLVNPYEDLRKELKINNPQQVLEIYLNTSRSLRKEYHVKDFQAGNPDYQLTTDLEPEESWRLLKSMLFTGKFMPLKCKT